MHEKWGLAALLAAVLMLSSPSRAGENGPQGGTAPEPTPRVPAHPVAWGYEGLRGPESWADLSLGFETCRFGEHQSPVDLGRHANGLGAIVNLAYHDSPLEVVNDGHTIQVEVPDGGTALFHGKSYRLRQFHFHAPSEHSLDGELFDMEIHFVHEDEHGRLAVLAVFVKSGGKNTAVEQIWEHLPRRRGTYTADGIRVNPTQLLPAGRTAFHYEGSLTTPPCTEGVSWYVLAEPIRMSRRQLRTFREVIGENNRPVQELNGRKVVRSGWE